MSLFQKIFQQFLRRFFTDMGREPLTPAEWMQIQDQAVRHLNKTKGAPSITKKPFEGWTPKVIEGGKGTDEEVLFKTYDKFYDRSGQMRQEGKDIVEEGLAGLAKKEEKITIDDLLSGPVRSKGPKGDRIWDFSQKKGERVDFPKKPKKGIEELIENEEIFVGKAPKTQKSTLDAKKDVLEEKISKEEWIAKRKQDNKDAIRRFKEKNPDKFYAGGIAPLVGEPSYAANFYDDRTPMAGGALVKGGRWFLKSLHDTKKQLMQLDIPLSKKQELMKQADDAIKQIEGGAPIPEQIIQHIRKDPKFKSVSQGPRATDPDLAEMEEVILEYGKRHAHGGRVSFSGGGQAGLPAITQETQTPQLNMQGPQMPAPAPQPAGISGANFRQNHMDMYQQQMHQNPYMQDQMKQGIGGMQKYGGQLRMPFAVGGMGRRAFLKMMAGIAALPFIGKSVTKKAAAPVVKEAAETIIERGADGIPSYAYDLIEVVKAKGTREIMEGIAKRNPPSTKYNYKGVDVIEDGTGGTSVRKEQTKTGSWTDEATDDTLVDDYVDREIGFEIKQGEIVKGKDGKPLKAGDEYNESTAYMQGDPDGGMDVSEITEVIDDADHLELKKIADEVNTITLDEEVTKIAGETDWDKFFRNKKASGGVAHLLGE